MTKAQRTACAPGGDDVAVRDHMLAGADSAGQLRLKARKTGGFFAVEDTQGTQHRGSRADRRNKLAVVKAGAHAVGDLPARLEVARARHAAREDHAFEIII